MKVVARNAGPSLWGRPVFFVPRVSRRQKSEERGSFTPVPGESRLVDVEFRLA